jgi:hypothetical protein
VSVPVLVLRSSLVALLAAGCGPVASDLEGRPDGGAAPGPEEASTFIPFQRDFQSFATWPHVEITGVAVMGNVHLAGKRTIYINQMPGHGQTAFAPGTLIVKVMETGEIFARAKRGGSYNAQGARGWEWFELKQVDGEWLIIWRGIAPPAGVCAYGAIVGGACNDCHRAFVDNDFVASAAFDLSKL